MMFKLRALSAQDRARQHFVRAPRAGLSRGDVEQRVTQAAAVLGLTDLLARKPGELSGGQRQRVAMGRAIVRDPAVFLFDEPLSNLDAELRTRLRSEIKKLHRKLRATVVYVTHDQVEAMTLADRIVILNKGKVEQVGSPTDVYAAPTNQFVAGFIGSPAMNMIGRDRGGCAISSRQAPSLPMCRTRIARGGDEGNFRIRPGHRPTPPGNVTAVVEAQVTMVEPLGAEFLLSFALNGHEITAKIAGRVLPGVGERLRFVFDMRHAHVFDGTMGQSLRR
jgi:multiple sugar transport system ATP-binding protein